MSVIVRVPAPLRSRTGGQRQIELRASSVKLLLEEMEAAYPGITERLRREDGRLRRALNIYVNGENIRFLQGLDTLLSDGDEVSIVPAIAGGRDVIESRPYSSHDEGEDHIMDLGLKGRTALVAASSRGLGKAIGFELAREGAKVAICARGREQLEATADEMRGATGAEVLPVAADVSRAEDCQQLVATVQEHFGGVDILVTNAGGPPAGYFLDFDDQHWRAAVDLTLMSAVRLIRLVLPSMHERRWGRIVNMVSISVKQPIEDLILSNSIRAAVVGMAKSIAPQFAAQGITVNNVCPTYTLTERVETLARARAEREGISYDEVLDVYREQIPARRLGRPEEIAALVTFLASERAAFITGTTIQIDGGSYRGLL